MFSDYQSSDFYFTIKFYKKKIFNFLLNSNKYIVLAPGFRCWYEPDPKWPRPA
jgi:hypothetical protein